MEWLALRLLLLLVVVEESGIANGFRRIIAFTVAAAHEGQRISLLRSTYYNLEAWDIRTNADPACIFSPMTADQVAGGVEIISTCDAQFAIRGGGHMNVSS